MKPFFIRTWSVIKNKYILTLILFGIWIIFLDNNNLISQFKLRSELNDYRDKKEYYLNEIQKDSTAMHQLFSNKENLIQFAREQYLMKKDNEDIYLIVKENKEK